MIPPTLPAMLTRLFIPLLCCTVLTARAAGPEVTIVTTPNPEALERVAAEELKKILESLFEAQVSVTDADVEAPHRILLGHPNPDETTGFKSRDLHYLKSTPQGLVLGGATPLARLWAVYEFGYRNGMRYLPTGDFLPLEPPAFTLDGYDDRLSPVADQRTWRGLGTSPASQASWSLADYDALFTQLIKMKFNRVELVMEPSQVFAGTVVPGSGIWKGDPIDVSGDIAGRSVFSGRKTFDHPAMSAAKTDEERGGTAVAFVKEVIAAAKKRGLSVTIELTGADEKQLTAIGDLYPGADQVTATPIAKILTFAQPGGGLMPHPAVIDPEEKPSDFAVEVPLVADHAQTLWQLSRSAFQSKSGPDEDLQHLIRPICGEGVVEPFRNGLAALTEAAELIAKEDPAFGVPGNPGFMHFYESGEPVPGWIAKGKELYGKAVGEFYRANTRARDGARPLLLRQAKRATFALHYVSAAEAARKAGIAKAAGDDDARIENLELAIEAIHNALAIYAEVATEPGDAGAIALINADAYRPLLSALEE
jgi:hypothetical protein